VACVTLTDALGTSARPGKQVSTRTRVGQSNKYQQRRQMRRSEEFARQNDISLDTGAGATLRACGLA
jgi:hypothetical protein